MTQLLLSISHLRGCRGRTSVTTKIFMESFILLSIVTEEVELADRVWDVNSFLCDATVL